MKKTRKLKPAKRKRVLRGWSEVVGMGFRRRWPYRYITVMPASEEVSTGPGPGWVEVEIQEV